MKKKFLIAITCLSLFIPSIPSLAAEHAFSVGTNEGTTSIDTSGSATYAANCFSIAGYTSNYSIQPTYSTLTGEFNDGTSRMESSILFFAGHANYNNINWDYLKQGTNKCGVWVSTNGTSSTTGYKYAGLKSYDLSESKIAMFFGCKTGLTDNGNNLVDIAHEQGVTTAIGWKDSVDTTDATKWRKAFVNELALGKSVKDARTYANSLSYNDTDVKNTYTRGSVSLTITEARTIGELVNEDENLANITYIDPAVLTNAKDMLNADSTHVEYELLQNINIDLERLDFEELENYISNNILPDFKTENFKVCVNKYDYENNSGNITFTYKIGDVETTSDLVIEVSDGVVYSISSNGSFELIPVDSIDIIDSSDNELITRVNEVQPISVRNNDGIIIENQNVIRKYDIEKNKYYAIVATEYYDTNSDSYWVEESVFYD